MTDSVTLFLAMLAVVAQVAVVVAVVLAVGGRWSPALARARSAAAEAIGPHALFLALCVAAVSTAGSIYFSEDLHFLPCKLCWYQRIAMYPLVPALAVATWYGDRAVRRYVLPAVAIGAGISTYHVLVERYPSLESSACEVSNPCSFIWFEHFGYLTIPAMALSGFALIATLVLVAGAAPHPEVHP